MFHDFKACSSLLKDGYFVRSGHRSYKLVLLKDPLTKDCHRVIAINTIFQQVSARSDWVDKTSVSCKYIYIINTFSARTAAGPVFMIHE